MKIEIASPRDLVLNVVLEVLLNDELELADYAVNFRRMFGNPRMDAVALRT